MRILHKHGSVLKPVLLIAAGLCGYSLLVASTIHYFPTEAVSAEGKARV